MLENARRTRRRSIMVVLVIVAVLTLGVGLWAFQPWKLFTSSRLDEGLPAGAQPTVSVSVPAGPAAGSTGSNGSTASAAADGPMVLAEGSFVSQEHQTSGLVKVLALPDGSRVLRIEGLAASDGPDLHVWLTDQAAGGEYGKYDDGRYVELGKLKATHGNQNYAIPAGIDLAGLRSAVIWCDRFNVAFGSAALSP
jgi:hypothetical protein